MSTTNPLLLTVRTLMSVIDGADSSARGRSLRISRYAMKMARDLGIPESEWETIELGALLHDLGRNAVLNDVVLQARPLDYGEQALMRTHPTIGWELLKDIPGLEGAAEIVLTHHERPDGKGYPRRLKADEIPLGARIVMVCAAFDAMTEDRPYRAGLSPQIALKELERESGAQFSAEVVETFVRAYHDGSLWEDFTRVEHELYVRKDRAAA